MNKHTAEKIMVDVIIKWGGAFTPWLADVATVRNSVELAGKIVRAGCGVELGRVMESAKIIRQWANIQNNTKVDLTDERLARQLAKCISANVGRSDEEKVTPVAGVGMGGGFTGGLW
jgi:hypothetical protein